ncbi:MAG: hypothetical protein LKK19_07315 [Bacteroidales bacterium]|jgi:hypothetical protein|nr:hypothetical protein [Bacteroidales bacterium]MCI2122494.1 hypothetical protein [Bacteroidales bacterium]MCI2145477.1 hypothetical protein [Bacteroidales bacterium]
MNTFNKILTYAVFPIIIILLAYFLTTSIMQPAKFNKEQAAREEVGIQRLKDIRTLQVAYKAEHSCYAPAVDSLIDFYNDGDMTIIKQIGSLDDSLAVARHLVKRETIKIHVKDTLFNDRSNFKVEALRYVPYSDSLPVQMKAVVKVVSGVDVPLFEACMPYGIHRTPGADFDGLLRGMDRQLIINLNAERTDTDRYPGLMVGSIDNPNNNAGNWE